MVDCHGSQCGFCTPGFVMSMWALYENQPAAAGLPHPRRNRRRALRQSVPLHRLPADRRCGAEDVRLSACPRVRRATAEAARITLRELQRRDTFEYRAPDARGAAFGTPPSTRRVRSMNSPSCAPRIRTRECSPAAPTSACGSPSNSAISATSFIIGNVDELKTIAARCADADNRRGRHAGRRVRRARRRLPGTRRTVDALRVAADPQCRHARRQRRERLADRRFDAGADRARRRSRAAPRPTNAHAAARRVLPRLSEDRARARRIRRGAARAAAAAAICAFAPTKCRSATIRTSRPCARHSRCSFGDNGRSASAHRVRRHGGHAEARRANRSRPERRRLGRKHRAASHECARRRITSRSPTCALRAPID